VVYPRASMMMTVLLLLLVTVRILVFITLPVLLASVILIASTGMTQCVHREDHNKARVSCPRARTELTVNQIYLSVRMEVYGMPLVLVVLVRRVVCCIQRRPTATQVRAVVLVVIQMVSVLMVFVVPTTHVLSVLLVMIASFEPKTLPSVIKTSVAFVPQTQTASVRSNSSKHVISRPLTTKMEQLIKLLALV